MPSILTESVFDGGIILNSFMSVGVDFLVGRLKFVFLSGYTEQI